MRNNAAAEAVLNGSRIAGARLMGTEPGRPPKIVEPKTSSRRRPLPTGRGPRQRPCGMTLAPRFPADAAGAMRSAPV
jgi:hypothetical protein